MKGKSVSPKWALQERELWRPSWGGIKVRNSALTWLDKNENPDPKLAGVIASVLANMPQSVHATYPEFGPLYRKLAGFFGIETENLILSNGSDGVIRSVFDAFVDPGDGVLHPHPTFAMYAVYCDIFGARPIRVEYSRNSENINIDVDSLLSAINREKPKLICVPNPDSPTGSVLPQGAITDILDAATIVGALVLIDEAYYPFCADTAVPEIAHYGNLLVTRSTGKAWGMAGLRVGIGIGGEDVIRHLHRVRPMYECNGVGAYVLENMIDRYDAVESSVERLIAGRDWFAERMRALGYSVIPTHGNFGHVAFGDDEQVVANALGDIVYYRRTTAHPCLEGYARFSATTIEKFQPIVDRIETCTGRS